MNLKFYNKDYYICNLEYDNNSRRFIDIKTDINFKHVPYSMKFLENASKEDILNEINDWFRNRSTSRERRGDRINEVIKNTKLGIDWFAASLSDQYFFVEDSLDLKWKDINFFLNSYNQELRQKTNSTFNHPNRTTSGMVDKTWIMEDGRNFLLKKPYFVSQQDTLNEVVASKICELLDIEHVNYDLIYYKNNDVCKCECMISQDEELIDAYSIMKESIINKTAPVNIETYRKILEEKNIENTRTLDGMILLDYLILNEDRHLGNFGLIHNIKTDEYKIAPIYDNGYSLCAEDLIEMKPEEKYAKFFDDDMLPFDRLLQHTEHIEAFNLEKLSNLKDEINIIVETHKDVIQTNPSRIEKIKDILDQRVANLKEYQNKYIKESNIPEESLINKRTIR